MSKGADQVWFANSYKQDLELMKWLEELNRRIKNNGRQQLEDGNNQKQTVEPSSMGGEQAT